MTAKNKLIKTPKKGSWGMRVSQGPFKSSNYIPGNKNRAVLMSTVVCIFGKDPGRH